MTNQILIIDKDNEFATQVALVLKDLNLSTLVYNNADNVEQILAVDVFRAILINLSTVNDIDKISNIKSLVKFSSMVVVMGEDFQGELIQQALESGADDCVRLPISKTMLCIRLKTLLRYSALKVESNLKHLDDTFNMLYTPAVIADAFGRILAVNYAALKIFSKTKETVIGELFGGFINCNKRVLNKAFRHDGCQGCALSSFGQAAINNDTISSDKTFKYTSLTSDGKEEEKVLLVTYSPVFYDGRKCVFINFVDITPDKNIEYDKQRFKTIENEYFKLLDNILSGFLKLEENNDGELIIKAVNARLCEIFSTSEEKLLGTSFSERLYRYNPKLQDAIKSVLQTGKQRRIEFQSEIYNKKWLKVNAFMFNPKTIVLIIGDNTTSRLTNERLRDMMKKLDERNFQFELFMQGSNDGAWSYDYINKTLFLSSQFKRQLGYESSELVLTRPTQLFDLIDENFRQGFVEKIREVNLGKLFKIECEIKLILKGGNSKWFLIRATVKSEVITGMPELIGGVITDISLRKQTEIELEDSNEKLQSAVETKNKFISIISHDLRNQFNAINGLSDILSKRLQNLDDKRNAQMALVISQSSQSAYKLLNNLLVWARSQMNKIDFEPQEMIVSEVTEEALDEVKIQAQKKHVALLNLTGKNDKIFADKQMYMTIVRNLVTNAIKFTKENGTVSVHSIENDSFTEITVADTGVGMSKQQAYNLLNAWKTTSTDGTSGEKGSGLGLMLCKEFVQKHNGKIDLETSLGSGTKFIISFPKRTV